MSAGLADIRIESRHVRLLRTAGSLLAALALAMLASLTLGLDVYTPVEAWQALTAFDGSAAHHVLRDLRLPRTLLAPLVGASLGIAGVLIQTLTRNRLASPGILGLNAGAALGVVIASRWLDIGALTLLSGAAALGALVTALAVYAIAIASRGSMSPARTVLAGITLAGLLTAFVEIVLSTDEATLEELLFWIAGGFQDRPLALAGASAWLLLAGVLLALAVARPLDALLTDDDTARALGIPLRRVRSLAFLAVSALTGGAVAMAGPIGFIGLIVPHVARGLVGLRHADLIVVAALAGALFAVVADVAARYVLYPNEAPVGVLTALLGAPVLIVLLRRSHL